MISDITKEYGNHLYFFTFLKQRFIHPEVLKIPGVPHLNFEHRETLKKTVDKIEESAFPFTSLLRCGHMNFSAN